jgi:hypothetical protein
MNDQLNIIESRKLRCCELHWLDSNMGGYYPRAFLFFDDTMDLQEIKNIMATLKLIELDEMSDKAFKMKSDLVIYYDEDGNNIIIFSPREKVLQRASKKAMIAFHNFRKQFVLQPYINEKYRADAKKHFKDMFYETGQRIINENLYFETAYLSPVMEEILPRVTRITDKFEYKPIKTREIFFRLYYKNDGFGPKVFVNENRQLWCNGWYLPYPLPHKVFRPFFPPRSAKADPSDQSAPPDFSPAAVPPPAYSNRAGL